MRSNPPIARRARSARSLANSAKVLSAVRKNATKVGLDELSASNVAKLCGLSTGSIYSRFEDTDEIAIALWEQVIRQPFKQRLQRGVDCIYKSNSAGLSINEEVTFKADFENPDELSKLGVEFLVVAKRNNLIGEVVIPEVSQWFNEFGLNQNNTEINNASVALGLSASIGTALRSLITKTNPNWHFIAKWISSAIDQTIPLPTPPDLPVPRVVEFVTDNPVRTALINSVAEVIANSGYARATVSRILRRANLKNGSLYNLYENKEDLINDALNLLLSIETNTNHESNRLVSLESRSDRGLANNFKLGLLPERQKWNNFRLECLIASRNHLPIRNKFNRLLETSQDNLAKISPDLPRETINFFASATQAVGLGFTTLDLFTDQLPRCDFYSIMTKLSEQIRLLSNS